MTHRSYLFVPGTRPDRFQKAVATDAHAVILDLEDAVGPGEKDIARGHVADWVTENHPVVLRLNGVDTAWFADDLTLSGKPGVTAVMLPKTESAAQLRHVRDRAPVNTAILPMIESATGMANAQEIAASPGVQRLVFGTLDFQVDLGIDGDENELLYFRSHLVLVSKCAGIEAPVDGICTNIEDVAGLTASTRRSRRLGFGGRLCIHPKQVSAVNACFLAADEEIAWARRVVDAITAAKGGVAVLDSTMIDRPVLLKAEAILREAERSGTK